MRLTVIGLNEKVDSINEDECLSDLVPQATMIGINETGHISDFVLKCKERLCDRAQLEITSLTCKKALRFISETIKLESEVLKAYVTRFRLNVNEVKTMFGVCKESCRWKHTNKVFTRLI